MTKEEQREYSLEVYYLRKKHGLCTYCGKKPALPENIFCAECREKKRQQGLKYYRDLPEEKKQKYSERASEKYHDRRAKKLCVWCSEPTGGPVYCKKHRVEMSLYQKEYRKRMLLKELEGKADMRESE